MEGFHMELVTLTIVNVFVFNVHIGRHLQVNIRLQSDWLNYFNNSIGQVHSTMLMMCIKGQRVSPGRAESPEVAPCRSLNSWSLLTKSAFSLSSCLLVNLGHSKYIFSQKGHEQCVLGCCMICYTLQYIVFSPS